MDERRFLVLGGYGAVGLTVARTLLRHTETAIVIAGRDGQRALEVSRQLAEEFPGRDVRGVAADAGDPESLRKALSEATMVVCCHSATHLAGNVVRAAIETGADYLDIHFSQEHVAQLESLAGEIVAAGRCCITQAGFHPGLAAAFVRRAAPFFDTMESTVVALAMKEVIADRTSLKSLLRDIDKDPGAVFRDGVWRRATWRDSVRADFGVGFGERSCYPIDLYEMRSIPEQHGLSEAGVYAAGFNWFVDSFVLMPAYVLHLNRWEWSLELLSHWFVWGLRRFTRPPFGTIFQLDARGRHQGHERVVRVRSAHEDGYLFTAIPVVACLRQYLDGSIRHPGLWMMGHACDPVRLLADMNRMGVRTEVTVDGTYVDAEARR